VASLCGGFVAEVEDVLGGAPTLTLASALAAWGDLAHVFWNHVATHGHARALATGH